MESKPPPVQAGRHAAPPPSRTLAWLVAIAIVVFGTWFAWTVLVAVWAPEAPPIVMLALPWPMAVVLGWSVRRQILKRRPRPMGRP